MHNDILHFLTGTMAFRSPQPDFWRNGAENPDAFLEKYKFKRIKMQDKLQNLNDMQEICRILHSAGQRGTSPKIGVKNKQGRNGLGNG